MPAKLRIYTVRQGEDVRLVRAANSTQARNHVAKDQIAVTVSTQDELVALAANVKVEEVGADDATE